MKSMTPTCDQHRLEAFLRGDLHAAEENDLALHLNDCAPCRQQLEANAAEPACWSKASEFLQPHDFTDEDSAARPPQRSLQIQHVLDALAPTDDPRMLGRFGGYEVSGVVGSGAMGVVLKALDRSLDRTVAIKVLAPHLASSGAARKRFAREAKAAAAVLHPNVMAIHSVSNDERLPYLVMPYLRGASLQKGIDDEGPLPLAEVLRIGSQIAHGLQAAHAQGLVHRDIKPANILLEEGVERVAITDFGLARAVDDATMTRSGVIAGTPQYMSPEQARGESIDQRSDLFSLGSVMYAMCTGRPPFRAETSYGVLRRISDAEPRPVHEVNPDVPEWLCQIIGRLMSKQPNDRFESAGEVAKLLEDCLAHVQQPSAVPLPWRKLPACDSSGRQAGSLPHGRKPWASAQRLIRSRYFKLIAAAAFALALIFAGILIVLETNKGTLTIESEADNVPIRITQGDKVVEKLTVSKSGASVRIAAGQYVVEIESGTDELAIEDGVVRLRRGGRDVVKIAKREASPENAVVLSDGGQPPTESYVPSIYVGGAVKNPSGWNFDPDGKIKILDAIALVGGLTDDAGDQVIITRTSANGERHNLKISIVRAKTDPAHNLPIAPGDIITVLSEGDSDQPGTTRIRVLGADGKPVADNAVIRGTEGYPGPNLPRMFEKLSHRGEILLDKLAGTHRREVIERLATRREEISLDKLEASTLWLLVRDNHTVLRIELPVAKEDLPPIYTGLPKYPSLIGKNVDVKVAVEVENDVEFIVIEIHNRSEEHLLVTEANLQLMTAIKGPQADARVMSPLWSNVAAGKTIPETTIRPGQSATVRLNWNDWVKHGYWFSRDGEVIAEPAFPELQPGTTWVRVTLGGAPPVMVTHPDRIVDAGGDKRAPLGVADKQAVREVENLLKLQATLVRERDYAGYLDLLTDDEVVRLAGVIIHQSTVVENLLQRGVNVKKEELFWASSMIQRSKLADPPEDALKAQQQLVEKTLAQMLRPMLRPGEMETPETYSRLLSTSAGILKDKRQFAVDMMASNPVAAGSKESVEPAPDWDVIVEGDRAFATDSTTLRYPITIELVRVDGHWKISSLFSDDVIMRMVSGAMFIGGDRQSDKSNEAAAKPADEAASLGIPDAKKLTGTWRGEKDGMAVELTFTTEKEWRMLVSTGRITLQHNPLVWEFIYDPPSIDLLQKFQHLGGIRNGTPGWDKIGELQDGEGNTLRINLLPRGYQHWYKYRPVDGLVLERGKPAPRKTISSGEDDTREKPQSKVAPGAPERVRQFATAAIGLTLAYSAHGKLIVVGNEGPVLDVETNRVANDWKPTADILDAQSGKIVVSLQLTTDAEDAVVAATKPFSHFEVTALAFSPDGNVVAVGTSIGQVKLFNARTGELVRSLDGEPQSWATLKRAIGSVSALAFSPDGNLLVTCGQSFADLSNAFDGLYKGRGRLRVWDVKTGAIKHDLVAHDKVRAAVFSPDGKMLASAGSWSGNRDSGSGVIIWNPQTGQQIRRITTNANADLGSAIAFSPSSKLLAIGSLRYDKASDTSTAVVTMTSALSGDFLWTRTVPQWVRTIAFSPDGKSVGVLSIGKPIQFLDTDNGRVQHEIRPADSEGSQWIDLAIAPQTRMMAISRVDDERQGNIELWRFVDEKRDISNSIEAEDRSGVLLGKGDSQPLAPRGLDEQVHIRKAIELRKTIESIMREVNSYEAIIKHHPQHEDLGGITARMQTARRRLAIYRDELAAQVRLLELELADAESAATVAAQSLERLNRVNRRVPKTIPDGELAQAQREVERAQLRVGTAETLLKLYRRIELPLPEAKLKRNADGQIVAVQISGSSN